MTTRDIMLSWVDRRELVVIRAADAADLTAHAALLRRLGDAQMSGGLVEVTGIPARVLAAHWKLNDRSAPIMFTIEDARTEAETGTENCKLSANRPPEGTGGGC